MITLDSPFSTFYFSKFSPKEASHSRIFKGIRPAVVALIAAPTFTMGRSAKINRHNLWIPVVSALLIWLLGFSPIWIIIAAGVGGFLWGKFRKVES